MAQHQHQRIKSEAQQQRQIAQMQQYLLSGDPILVAEARAWAEVNSGVLKGDQLQLPLTQSRFMFESIEQAKRSDAQINEEPLDPEPDTGE